ncbi:MAG: hypothetical protein CSA39_06880 [Flavobacteriales bacterium]|nr:MAG: hypothetical protein CR985_00900 [Flavobacteriales bacterium]PIE48602.1 MAG: hypothetical protein CSA39_06880 [Flavobacteriales bacterium]
MNDVLQLVENLEEKLEKLIAKHDLLQIENHQLLERSEMLAGEVKEKELSIATLEEQYESLKVANAIVGSKADKHSTKLKINALIREIDKCIVQLSE